MYVLLLDLLVSDLQDVEVVHREAVLDHLNQKEDVGEAEAQVHPVELAWRDFLKLNKNLIKTPFIFRT